MRRVWKAAVLGLGLGVLPLGLPMAGGIGGRTWEVVGALDHELPGEIEMQQAQAARRAMRGARGAELLRLRRVALERFRRVAKRYPKSGVICAEAFFRSAELQRAAGDIDGALRSLDKAMNVDAGGDFVPRARYEAAHLLRREKRLGESLRMFASVEVSSAAGQHRRNLASLWHAKVTVELGRDEAAEDQLRLLVKRIVEPCDRLRAYDELILLVTANQRIEAAVGYFAQAKLSVLAASSERTERGDRVRKALENMRALDVLQSLIDARFHQR